MTRSSRVSVENAFTVHGVLSVHSRASRDPRQRFVARRAKRVWFPPGRSEAAHSWRRPSTGSIRAAQRLGANVLNEQMASETMAVMMNSSTPALTGTWSIR